MIGKRAAVIVLVAVGMAAIVLTWTVRQHAGPAVSAASPAPAPALPSALSPAPPPALPSALPPAGGGPSGAPAMIASAGVAAPPSRAAAAVAEPFVQTFADQPGVRPRPPVPSPTATLRIAANIDGCDHNYGAPTQCVPWTFPAGTADKCGWLTEHGFAALKVVGTDRQHLDPDHDRIAC
jgi:hypothetical protein